jgi:hypothetical protein
VVGSEWLQVVILIGDNVVYDEPPTTNHQLPTSEIYIYMTPLTART